MKFMGKILFLLLACGTAVAQFPSQIKNVIVIVQENRTPDNLFHFLPASSLCPLPSGTTVTYNSCIPVPPDANSQCYVVSTCGLSNQDGTLAAVTLTGVALSGSVDPDHSHSGFYHMCDPDASFHCVNDGAYKTSSASYSYVENPAVTNYDGSHGTLLEPYLYYARNYGWANYMFQTNQGPSYPAHQLLFSGTSALTNANDTNSIFVSENFDGETVGNTAGCLLTPSTTSEPTFNFILQPGSKGGTDCTIGSPFDASSVQECALFNTKALYPTQAVGNFCTNHNNMATTVLDPRKITWKYYAPSAGSIWTAPDAIEGICSPQFVNSTTLECSPTSEFAANVDTNNHGTDILTDITDCKLSRVSWVIPDGAWSDHAGNDPYGPSWVTAVINAVGTNPTCPEGTPDAGQKYWHNTAIIVTWDDWGGWSDNQPAPIENGLPCQVTTPPTPCPGDYQLGFRVPLLVVSAYTPPHYVSNFQQYDFGTILRMIEGINGLKEGLMGNADARSKGDLARFFTLTSPRSYTVVPAVEPASFFLTYTGATTPPDND
jgi:phospholipase C